ncbi:PIG-L family deacetylase [Bythopirellula polymerisocia]|uniref:Mycothiol S-conjugate amidase n=1 Tax=Bythopirellula polymerisocia TaxID=2528003 RepID=A0A5C6CRD8_9BACT|nr:PIG-L family deacetylase [Bythopirellula polymerisocia]TWU26097.1 Mycothiol S-conjugate amidase [Bythopirellula polymerisocia]
MATNDYPQLDVIAVGAHPDDVEIGCGGTLAQLVRQGYQVGIIDLTDGEPTPASSGPEERLAESLAAAEALGIQHRVTLDLPNRKLFDSYEARVKLATEFRKFRPRLVLGLGEKTPLASPDHWQAMQITDAAVFYSRLTKWDIDFTNLPPHTIAAQMYYTLESHRAAPLEGAGHMVVDIGETLAAKLAAVRCYKSQFPPEKQYIFPRIEAIASQLGHAAGYLAGELLVSPRTLGTRDLMGTLFDNV